ncbi:hypothetical protein ACFQ0K_19510 [Nocardioides caeni]|uniref:PQ-loop repeat-containing protein n=1 Tax=Nocardioides caeni TaxID=574700 RepID=A0A4S8NFQ3_9ACTN|nr:hypothetical protein [Nocardioides caeni]THV14811.1 hypothetical protein E9934_09220 [Nocardioides caeni]
MIEAVGYVGSAGAASMWIPQAWRAVRHRADPDLLAPISLATYLVAMAFNALLITYGATKSAAPVVVAGVANLVCATVIVAVLLRSRARNRR